MTIPSEADIFILHGMQTAGLLLPGFFLQMEKIHLKICWDVTYRSAQII
jgi:hypothetical protein